MSKVKCSKLYCGSVFPSYVIGIPNHVGLDNVFCCCWPWFHWKNWAPLGIRLVLKNWINFLKKLEICRQFDIVTVPFFKGISRSKCKRRLGKKLEKISRTSYILALPLLRRIVFLSPVFYDAGPVYFYPQFVGWTISQLSSTWPSRGALWLLNTWSTRKSFL